jgi:hypothetical protein
MDSAWARMTGTRMQVAVMATSLSPQILRVSFTCGGHRAWLDLEGLLYERCWEVVCSGMAGWGWG